MFQFIVDFHSFFTFRLIKELFKETSFFGNKFSGKVYLLTGPFTFSSGMMVADAAKQFGLAKLIREPTNLLERRGIRK